MNASISHFAEKWGRHDLKFGVEIERSRVRDRNYYINGNYYYNYGGAPYYAYSGSNYDVSGRNRRESVFVQDAWKPSDRLTLNLGVRMDHFSGGAPDEDSVYTNTVFAPRLGFAFDLTGRGTTVLKGSYSQYYEGIFNDLYKLATTGYEDAVGWNMSGCPAFGPSGPTADYRCPLSMREETSRLTQPVATVDSNIKHPRVDEFSLGIEHQFGRDWRVSATGVYRENKNFIGNILPDARWEQISLATTASTPIDGLRRLQRLARRQRDGLPLDQPRDLDRKRVHHEPRRLPVPRPERQRGRDDGRVPQVHGADADGEQALLEPLAGAGVLRALEVRGHRQQHLGVALRDRAASSRRRRSASSTATGARPTTGRTR